MSPLPYRYYVLVSSARLAVCPSVNTSYVALRSGGISIKPRVFIVWVEIAEKVFKVRDQRSRSLVYTNIWITVEASISTLWPRGSLVSNRIKLRTTAPRSSAFSDWRIDNSLVQCSIGPWPLLPREAVSLCCPFLHYRATQSTCYVACLWNEASFVRFWKRQSAHILNKNSSYRYWHPGVSIVIRSSSVNALQINSASETEMKISPSEHSAIVANYDKYTTLSRAP